VQILIPVLMSSILYW